MPPSPGVDPVRCASVRDRDYDTGSRADGCVVCRIGGSPCSGRSPGRGAVLVRAATAAAMRAASRPTPWIIVDENA